VTFFERYFAALDGPDPHSSLELVADDVEFAIQWADGSDRASRQFVGGLEDLRAFIDAGDMRDWAHHVLFGATTGDVEGRMARYLVARSPAIAFESGLRIDAGAD
jgi:hypothetical protein